MLQTSIRLVGLIFYIIATYSGLEIIPERTKLVYANPKFFYNCSINIKRYSRTSPYYYNMEMTMKQTWTNNVSVHVIFNEFLHNEYRRSFVEVKHKFCDLIEYDKFIGPMIKNTGISCPMKIGTLRMSNFSFSMENFPNVFPFEKCRVDSELKVTDTDERMLLMYHYIKLKNKQRT